MKEGDVLKHKACKYRIYPNKEQQNLLSNTFGCTRLIYNHFLDKNIKQYETNATYISYTMCAKELTEMKKTESFSFLKEVDSMALQQSLRHLDTAYQNFFKNSKFGFPKHKSKKYSRKSYTTNCVNGNIVITDKSIKLPKVGYVKAIIHRIPDKTWLIKSATISQEADNKFYVSVLFEFDQETSNNIINTNNAIGLDYASDGLYVDNNGNIGSNHKYYRESHKKLAKAQRKLSRMIEQNTAGYKIIKNNRYPVYKRPLDECKNIQKQKLKIAKIHTHIANQRLDNLHKTSTEIANQYDTVCVERLNMKAMSNHGFRNGKATLDNGYGLFLSMLEYKLTDRNKHLIKIDKWFPSSQICHQCGQRHHEMKDLHMRVINCDCGLSMSRDQNAAINILNEGLRIYSETA